jgi:hypothetical protein
MRDDEDDDGGIQNELEARLHESERAKEAPPSVPPDRDADSDSDSSDREPGDRSGS